MLYKRWCENCLSEMYRMYLRSKILIHDGTFEKHSRWDSHSKYERGFHSIGWYCNKCKLFDLDKEGIIEEILERRSSR